MTENQENLKELKFKLTKSKYKSKGKVNKPEDLCNVFFDLKDWAKETMLGVYISNDLEINLYAVLSVGTKTCTVVAIPEILDNAIITRSENIILIHNHPAGDPNPSEEDLKFIEAIKKAAEATERTLLDFIIIGDNQKYWSMFESEDGGEYSLGKAF